MAKRFLLSEKGEEPSGKFILRCEIIKIEKPITTVVKSMNIGTT